MRAIAAFGIFAIHATGVFAVFSDFNSKAMHLGIFLNQFFRFGTPIFMAISGLVLFYNYRVPEEFNFKAFAKKKFIYIIVPYVLWSLGYYFFKGYIYNMPITMDTFNVFLRGLPTGKTFAHLYFIFLIVQFYLLFPILIKLLGKHMKKSPTKVFIVSFVLQAALLIYQYYFKKPTSNWALSMLNTYYWKTVFGWFFYFIFGGLIAFHYERVVDFIERYIKPIFIGYIVSITLFMGEVYLNIYTNGGRQYYERFGSIRPMNLIYGVFTFFMLIWITRKIQNEEKIIVKIFKTCGTYSLGIYFLHPMVLEYIKQKLLLNFPGFIGYSRLSSVVIIVGLGWVLTMLLCYFISIFKFRWLLLGRVPSIIPQRKAIKQVEKTN